MERNDASVFDEIDVLELRYFNNNKREIPLACNATLKVNRNENLIELAGQMKIHAYIDGGKPEDRIRKIDSHFVANKGWKRISHCFYHVYGKS